METKVDLDLNKTIEYLQKTGVNVKVYKSQPPNGKENANSSNKGNEKVISSEKAIQTDKFENVSVSKYQPTKENDNASSSNKGKEEIGSSEKGKGKVIPTENKTSKRKLAQRMRRERESLDGLSQIVPTTTRHLPPSIIEESGIDIIRTDSQATSRIVLPRTPVQVNIIHGEEASKGKENTISSNKGMEEVGSSKKEKRKVIETEINASKRKLAQRMRRERERLEGVSRVVPITTEPLPLLLFAEGGIERNRSVLHETTSNVLRQIPERVNNIPGDKVVSKIIQNIPSKRVLAQRLRRERERLEHSKQPGTMKQAKFFVPLAAASTDGLVLQTPAGVDAINGQ